MRGGRDRGERVTAPSSAGHRGMQPCDAGARRREPSLHVAFAAVVCLLAVLLQPSAAKYIASNSNYPYQSGASLDAWPGCGGRVQLRACFQHALRHPRLSAGGLRRSQESAHRGLTPSLTQAAARTSRIPALLAVAESSPPPSQGKSAHARSASHSTSRTGCCLSSSAAPLTVLCAA